MLLVVRDLFLSSIIRHGEKLLNALRHHVGVKNNLAVDVSRCASGSLNQTRGAAQITFLVRVENRHERDFGQIEPFAQQVDADEHVEITLAQSAEDFDALNRVNLAVQVPHVDPDVAQVIRQFLRRAFRESCDQDAFLLFDPLARFFNEIVDLSFERFDGGFRIHESGRANDEFNDFAAGPFNLARARCGADVNGLLLKLLKFLEAERTIVERAGETEAVFHQDGLARHVAGVHAADLRDGCV